MNNHIKPLANGDFEVVPLDDPQFIQFQRRRDKIWVFDDFLSKEHSDALEKEVKSLPYFYKEQTSEYTEDVPYIITTPETKDYGQMVSPILHHSAENLIGNYLADDLKPLYYELERRLQTTFAGIVRIKANILLQQPTASEDHYNIPHQDSAGKTLSMVYYCNDSDGDTVLFNEFYSETPPTRLTIREKIQPKKNRVVVFESNRYHASSNPIHTKARFVLNFVIAVEK